MTRIDHLRINGFKGIDNLEVEPNSINLITGRNNTGKTSLLEAVDIVFNPESIGRFKKNLDKVINAQSSSGSVGVEFRRSQQLRLDDFDTSEPEKQVREVGFREPRPEEVADIFDHTLKEIIDLNEGYPIRIEMSDESGNLDSAEFNLGMKDTLQDVVTEIPIDDISAKMKNNIIILEIEGYEYAYINLGLQYNEVRDDIVSRTYQKLVEERPQVKETLEQSEHSRNLTRDIRQAISANLAPRFGSNRFVGEDPSTVDGVKMIDSTLLEADEISLAEENSAVRISDIEDYLKHNDIVENLNDFSFDSLVFEDDDEGKYEIPYQFMGDGFKTIVGVLWEVLSKERTGNVLLLEEPDVHMHPGYIEGLLEHLVQIVRTNDIQIFITTHNIDTIEGFFTEKMDEKQGEYLEENLQIIQLTDPVSRTLDYRSAEEEIEELGIDLRGI
ncbi:AAA family ATPase [Haloarcula sp. H-GB4]|uniref:AAA family ATPase n=1 Tax=Haloarcula sp. H-GB4 TaxID=3069755 RepID=UPI0027B133F0|nr:AAA family ATPase [Haloarcula sp. H-GB4]MDQ2072713.1 AAA family ATPase [Haloarcula sp. H-GB4]